MTGTGRRKEKKAIYSQYSLTAKAEAPASIASLCFYVHFVSPKCSNGTGSFAVQIPTEAAFHSTEKAQGVEGGIKITGIQLF